MRKGRWKNKLDGTCSSPGAVFYANMARRFSKRKQYFIPIEGKLIEVTREVYITYYQAERRERYLMEKEQKYGVIYMGADQEKYMEKYSRLQKIDQGTEAQAVERVFLDSLIKGLGEKEQEVFYFCCLQGYSLRAAADRMGIHYLKARRMLKGVREKLKNQL